MRPALSLFVICSLGAHLSLGAFADPGPTQSDLNQAGKGGDWLLINHDYQAQRYVDLKQINRDNASLLRPVCIYAFGDLNRFASNPLVYQGVMYVSSGNTTVALDAATCELRWRHEWKPKAKEATFKRGDVAVNPFKSRGVALKDDKLLRSTTDSYLIALDIKSGALLWERSIANAEKYELMIMAPLVYEDLVITGVGISEFGVKGWIGAFRQSDGEPVWRFNTVPGDSEPGAETWSDVAERKRGGGGVWVTPSLDVEKELLYAAVGNPVPDFFGDTRQGANLYTAAMIVLDVRTGTLKWYRQFVPHDVHDWDLTAAGPIYNPTAGSMSRPLVAVGGKDGFLRAVDRETREQIFATSVTTQTNTDVPPSVEGVHACPGVLGGMQWSAPAFNPVLNVLLAPSVDWCGLFKKADELRYVQGQLYMGGAYKYDPVEASRGWLTAVDASTGAVKWRFESKRPMLAAVTTTSSGLVFTGELTGNFLVLDGRNGDVLYRFNAGVPLLAGVVTYAVKEKQYAAVASGSAASFWQVAPASSTVIVFALP